MRYSSRLTRIIAILLIVAQGSPAGAGTRPSYRYEVLALLGTRAPGGGALRGAFEPTAIGLERDVLYAAGVGSRGAKGLFLDTLDEVLSIAAPGEEAADGWRFAEQPGVLGGVGLPVAMNGAGDIAFTADLNRDAETGAGVFLWERETHTLRAVALSGGPAPGGGTLGDARPGVAFDPSGAVLFSARIEGVADAVEGPAEGLFRFLAGETASLVIPGDNEPGGGRFVRAGHPSANSSGKIAFEAAVLRDGRLHSGIFVAEEGRLRSLVEVGALLADGSTFRGVREPRIDRSGAVTFLGDTGEWAIYQANLEGQPRLAWPGMPLPDGDRVSHVADGPGSLAVSQGAAMALVLRLEEAEASGVFLHGHDGLNPVALPGTFLAGVGPVDNVGDAVALSEGGDVAFQAELADGQIALVLATPVPSGG
jgi:hypothetical protein